MDAVQETAERAASGRQRLFSSENSRKALNALVKYGAITWLVGLVLFFSFTADRFLSLENARNILSQVAILGMLSGGITLALVMGQFDLSIGAATTMGGILVTKILAGPQWPIPLAIAVTIGGGVVLGLINAFVVNRLRVTAFIATLGTMSILTGVYHWYSNDSTVYYGIPPAFTDIATTRVVGVPMPVVIMVATLILLWVFLERTQTGRHIKATGGNYQAARLSGIRVGRMIAIGFVVSGICAFLAGIVLASQLGAGQLNAGEGFLLNSFAAAFIGAAVLKPGQFHIVGTLVGVLLLGVLVNGFLLLNVDSSFQYMVSGAVLIVALAISGISGRHPRA